MRKLFANLYRNDNDSMSKDISQELQAQVLDAYKNKTALDIQAGNSKLFYGHTITAQPLDVSQHQGVISYEPTELVITARAGSRLIDIEKVLDDSNQMLAFEPPHFSDSATLGGTIAGNFSGPRRASSGAARDFVLGCNIINGKAEALSFGGQVMKNVAGYDTSRLMCGAMGGLGVILDVSLKVLPKPATQITLSHQCSIHQATKNIHQWVKQSLPISASCFFNGQLYVRLSGNNSSVMSAKNIIGGELLAEDDFFWNTIKNQQADFFNAEKPLWRLSLASNTPELKLTGNTLYEWNGALRWLSSDEPAEKIRQSLNSVNGQATCYKHSKNGVEPFHPLSAGLFNIHKQLKNAFDPENILNPNRMYKDL